MSSSGAAANPPQEEPRATSITPAIEADDWASTWAKRLGVALVIGFFWPLAKSSIFFDEMTLFWPWTFLFGMNSFDVVAALTPADPEGPWFFWALVPLAGGAALLWLRRTENARTRALGICVVGVATLGALLFLFPGEALAYGLLFLAPDLGLQLYLAAFALGAGLIAIGTHVRRRFSLHIAPRALCAAGALAILATLCIPLGNDIPLVATIADGPSWQREWAIEVAVLALVAYAVLGFTSACTRLPLARCDTALTLLPRLLLVWLPVAYLILRQASDDGFASVMLEGGGGSAVVLIALIKCCAIYYSAMFAAAVGAGAFLQSALWARAEAGAAVVAPVRVARGLAAWSDERRLSVAGGGFVALLVLVPCTIALIGGGIGTGEAARPNPGDVAWEFDTHAPFLAGPVVAGGQVFAGAADGQLRVHDVASGAIAWTFAARDGIAAAPAVFSGRVFVSSRDHHLYALREGTGDEIWSFDAGVPIETTPAVSKKVVCFGTRGEGARVFGLDPGTGAKLWEVALSGRLGGACAIDGPLVYIGEADYGAGRLHAVEAETGESVLRIDTGRPITTSLCVNGELVYFGSNGTLCAWNTTTQEPSWSIAAGDAIRSAPLLDDGLVWVGTNEGRLIAVEAASGRESWRFDAHGGIHTTPAIAGDRIALCTMTGSAYILDKSTRETLQTISIQSLQKASPALAGGLLYNADSDGVLRAVRID